MRPSSTPLPHSVRLTSAERGKPERREPADQSTYLIETFVCLVKDTVLDLHCHSSTITSNSIVFKNVNMDKKETVFKKTTLEGNRYVLILFENITICVGIDQDRLARNENGTGMFFSLYSLLEPNRSSVRGEWHKYSFGAKRSFLPSVPRRFSSKVGAF